MTIIMNEMRKNQSEKVVLFIYENINFTLPFGASLVAGYMNIPPYFNVR